MAKDQNLTKDSTYLGTAYFVLDRLTSGAIKYTEYNPANGKRYNSPNEPGCLIGSTYLRKSELPMNDDIDPKWPKKIRQEIYIDHTT